MFILPRIDEVRRIVEEELPAGHHLLGVELKRDPVLTQATAPFALVIGVREDLDANAAAGVAYEIAARIRKRCEPQNVQIRFHWSTLAG